MTLKPSVMRELLLALKLALKDWTDDGARVIKFVRITRVHVAAPAYPSVELDWGHEYSASAGDARAVVYAVLHQFAPPGEASVLALADLTAALKQYITDCAARGRFPDVDIAAVRDVDSNTQLGGADGEGQAQPALMSVLLTIEPQWLED